MSNYNLHVYSLPVIFGRLVQWMRSAGRVEYKGNAYILATNAEVKMRGKITLKWSFCCNEMRGTLLPAMYLLVSRYGLCSVELEVNILLHLFPPKTTPTAYYRLHRIIFTNILLHRMSTSSNHLPSIRISYIKSWVLALSLINFVSLGISEINEETAKMYFNALALFSLLLMWRNKIHLISESTSYNMYFKTEQVCTHMQINNISYVFYYIIFVIKKTVHKKYVFITS